MAAATRYVGSRTPVTCFCDASCIVRMHRIVRVHPHRIVCRCIFRVARRRERDGVCARAQRADQAAPQASSIKSHSLCTCSAHAAVVPCHKDPVAFARPHAAVATRSRHACVMGCAARRASGLEVFGQYVRPNSAWQHMLVASVHRGEMWPAEPMRDWHRRVPPAYYYLWRYMCE